MIGGVGLILVVLFFTTDDASIYIDLPSLGIVVVGTLASTFMSYPMREVLRIFRLLGTVLRNERMYARDDIEELVRIARLWMTGDLRAVEAAIESVANPFLATGLRLVVDNTPEEDILELLHWRIARMRAREHAEAQLFRVMAGFAPAFGMIGTLIGLANMMFILGDGDITAIGQQLAVAMMTTFYGILLANLVLRPVAVKLERRTEERVVLMNMVLQGITMMCHRRSPVLMRETLNSFLIQREDELREVPRGGTRRW
jgi:chemotaxis protein MotA